MIDCVFFHLNKKEILFENKLALAFFDSFPVSKGHILIIPKRHCDHYFELNKDEVVAIFELSLKVRQYLDDKYHPDGYNIGFNVLEAGGQSVMLLIFTSFRVILEMLVIHVVELGRF